MNRRETRITANLIAVDPNGNQCRIVEYTDFVETTEYGQTTISWAPEMKSYRLSTGASLKMNSPAEFELTNDPLIKLRVLPQP